VINLIQISYEELFSQTSHVVVRFLISKYGIYCLREKEKLNNSLTIEPRDSALLASKPHLLILSSVTYQEFSTPAV
jgi:hypothetical protein